MQRTFVAVLRGETPETAKPIFATEDSRVVEAVAPEIVRSLTQSDLNAGHASPRVPLETSNIKLPTGKTENREFHLPIRVRTLNVD